MNSTLIAKKLHASAIFARQQDNESRYETTYTECWDKLENVRSSGRLVEARLKIGDHEVGDLVKTLTFDAEHIITEIITFDVQAIDEFRKSEAEPSWPEEQTSQLDEIAKRTHRINEMIEERISLTN